MKNVLCSCSLVGFVSSQAVSMHSNPRHRTQLGELRVNTSLPHPCLPTQHKTVECAIERWDKTCVLPLKEAKIFLYGLQVHPLYIHGLLRFKISVQRADAYWPEIKTELKALPSSELCLV